MIVRDGEGTSHLSRFICVARGTMVKQKRPRARSLTARSCARAGAAATELGRILCALGYSKADVDETIVDVGYARPGARKILFCISTRSSDKCRLENAGQKSLQRQTLTYTLIFIVAAASSCFTRLTSRKTTSRSTKRYH